MAEKPLKEVKKSSGHGDEIGDGDGEISSGIDFCALPEGCIAAVISFTSPRHACVLATVSKIFNSAADSDAVWERFLPTGYRRVLESYAGGAALLSSLSRKELFFHLSHHPLLLDGGSKSFSLDRSTGKKCYTIAARELDIIWGDTPRYWKWRSAPLSRFPEVAVLVTICLHEIQGKMRTSLLSPHTNYGAYLVFRMARRAYGFNSPAKLVVKTAGGNTETRSVHLDPQQGQKEEDSRLSQQRADGWLEVEIGEFWVGRDADEEVEMLVVKTGNWIGGLVVEGIEIRPKAVDV